MSEAVNGNSLSRKDHLEWCKKRAKEAMQGGNYAAGWASFVQDMAEHPETRDHVFLATGNQLVFGGKITSVSEMEKHIDGYE